jgi:hypothetical protein
VVVEIAPGAADPDKGDASFDQPASEKCLLSEAVATISIAQPRVFFLAIERPPRVAGGHHLHRPPGILIKVLRHIRLLDLGTEVIHLSAKRIAVVQAVQVDASRQLEPAR